MKPTGPTDARSSDEAIRKRRAARAFNVLLAPDSAKQLDGRSEIRRRRLLAELEKNSNNRGKALKPVDVLQHINELLELGESVEKLRKVVRVQPLQQHANTDPETLTRMLSELHHAYGFRRETYDFLGLSPSILDAAGIDRRSKSERSPAKSPSRSPRTTRKNS